MFEKFLQEIGLNEKEAALYLALLQVDNASVIDVSKKTKINRSTVYVVLEGLMKKGLVSETQIGKKIHYQAEPPERLETFVERQKTILEERSRRLKTIIPEIKSIQRDTGERPIVKYFEGRAGIISSLEEFYTKTTTDRKEDVYLIYPRDMLKSLFTQEEQEKYRKIRLKNEIVSKVVYTQTEGDAPSAPLAERIKIDAKKYPIRCDIAAYNDRVKINVLEKGLGGFLIKSKDFADTIKSLVQYVLDHP